MRKTLLFMSLLGFVFSTTFAQLSTRENDATVEKLSARPEKGDMSLTFAIDLVQDAALLGSNPGDSSDTGIPFRNRLFTGDLLTYKYYTSDQLAIRAGLRLYKNSKRSSGTTVDSSFYFPVVPVIAKNKYVRNNREILLAGGVERHFAKSNIFDVYAAADLLLGFGQYKTVMNEDYSNEDYTNITMKDNRFILGGEFLTGFNIFIAHLPLSVGLEYGLYMKWTAGKGKTKVKREDKIGDDKFSTTYYMQSFDPFGVPDPLSYDKLRASEFDMNTNQNVRLTINIYFSKNEKETSGAAPQGTQY